MANVYIRSGKLRRRVDLQALTAPEAANAYNEKPPTNWQTIATVWAGIEPQTGREVFASGQVQADTTHRVTLRWHAAVANAERLLVHDPKAPASPGFPQGGFRVFNILDVQNLDERDRTLVLTCKEITA
jgi:SPP1 family predicted phage head-tail adaptor